MENISFEQSREFLYSTALLTPACPAEKTDGSREKEQAEKLNAFLKQQGLDTRVERIAFGPAVNRFELNITPGLDVSLLAGYQNEMAREMNVRNVRLEVPIPGTSMIGIEVPHEKLHPVMLREVMESEEMKSAPGPLSVALGKDVEGRPVVCNLERMPHLMMCGITGIGKSNLLNCIILSLLHRNRPEELQLLLYDGTGAEYNEYTGLPHLMGGKVQNDAMQMMEQLKELRLEMQRRYELFREKGVRNLSGYNAALKQGEAMLPRIVCIVDNFSDLMMPFRTEAEETLCALAVLGRGAGIHVVLSCLRAVPELITGSLKAHFSSRIAFMCTVAGDSRVILDRTGAERLAFQGDMLYMPASSHGPIRVQGCFAPQEDIWRVCQVLMDSSKTE